ncbi:MAG: DUF4293 domain-containing protein [Paludibacteraceae bacterium]|nr:DUF4293 domain-containing protein [Candidatus Colicola coprequi]MCQ2333872.1 DUF4293 domain-containing protein [Paludibacteraceae bacterium]
MLQRIQTVYLFLIVFLGIYLCFVPVLQFTTPEEVGIQRMFELGAQGLQEVCNLQDGNFNEDADASYELKGTWGLMVTPLLMAFLALVNIFLFKKRILQARINIFLAVLCLGYYAMLFMYVWFATRQMGVEWHLYFWSCLPLICFVLTLMATRRILKDEALVRAADRIR